MRILWDSGNVGFGGCGINEWDRFMIQALRDKGHDVVLIVDNLLAKRPKFPKWKPPASGFTRYEGEILASNYTEIYQTLGPFDVQVGNHFTMFPICDRIVPIVHDVAIPGRPEYSLSISLTLRALTTLTDTFACTTPFIESQVKSIVPAAKTNCLYGGCKFAGLPREPKTGGKEPYIAYWGNRYEQAKNFKSLVSSLRYHDLNLEVASFLPPPESEFKYVESQGLLNRINYNLGLDDEALRKMVSGAEMYVCPSKYEGMGLPVMEAMSLGVPVVIAPYAALPGMVEDAGYVAKSAGAKDLAAAINLCLSNPLETQAKVRKAQEKTKQWTWELAADRLLSLLG